jgi:hypothetical protein
MEFKCKILEPSYHRKPYFDGYDTEKADSSFDCIDCGNMLEIPFDEILESAYNWKEKVNQSDSNKITNHFDLNDVGKSHDGGIPSIFTKQCEQCKSKYLFYFGLREYHHSVYKVVKQGISQILITKLTG